MENRVKILLILLVIISIALIIYFMKFNEKNTSSTTAAPLDNDHGISADVSRKDLHLNLKSHFGESEKERLSKERGMYIPLFDSSGELDVVPFADVMDISERYAEAALAIAGAEIYNLEETLGVGHMNKLSGAIKQLQNWDILDSKNVNHSQLAGALLTHLAPSFAPNDGTLAGAITGIQTQLDNIRAAIFKNIGSTANSNQLKARNQEHLDTRYMKNAQSGGRYRARWTALKYVDNVNTYHVTQKNKVLYPDGGGTWPITRARKEDAGMGLVFEEPGSSPVIQA